MLRNDGRCFGPKRQGGWIQFAVMAGLALLGNRQSKKAASNANATAQQALSVEERIKEQELELAKKQEERSGKLFEHYEQNFMPAERSLVNEAFGNELSPARAEARATTDVRDALSTAREISGRNQRRYGIDPTSGGAQERERATMIDEATLEAGARTSAREGVRDKNFLRQLDAVSIGRGLPGTSSASLGAAQSGVSNAASRAAARTRSLEGLAYETGADYGSSMADLAELAGQAYDMYRTRTTTPTDSARGGSWG